MTTTDDGDPVVEPVIEAVVEPVVEGEGDAAVIEPDEASVLLSDDGDGAGDADGEGAAEALVAADYVYTPPEGVTIDDATQARMTEFSNTAVEMGLSQDQYQQLIDYDGVRSAQLLSDAQAQAVATVQSWGEASRADPEFGGDNLEPSLALALRAQGEYASPALKQMLQLNSPDNPQGMGLGNHPEVLRMFYRIGKAMGDSEIIEGDDAAPDNTSLQRMYPTMFPPTG